MYVIYLRDESDLRCAIQQLGKETAVLPGMCGLNDQGMQSPVGPLVVSPGQHRSDSKQVTQIKTVSFVNGQL